ncbi:TlpA family protein disulfide reductase [Pedobacter gandavensis]|uniref:Redoxin domain-containing protein n=1 Tax=Pedobacter gandavensis TaxID=2679963 RepID=A0ABR6F2Y7_9SPHI|nr:TlpA disulfide reductase family protein [Pedobacter gandavensis]MBB2151379.1 redoxin domain-containing protein [Pedobacter gandavensis]
MKKITLIITGLLFSLCSSAQMAQIWGTVKSDGFDDKDITLYAIKNGETEEITKTRLAKDGSFGFLFNPEKEGMYAIGWGEFIRGKYPVYLKKGDKAQVAINTRTFDFIGQQTPENTVLYKWVKMSESMRYNAFHSMQPPKEFFPTLEVLATKAEAFKKTIQTKNPVFNKSMKAIVGYDLDLYALNFMVVPRGVFLTKEQLSPYYSTIVSPTKFQSLEVLGMLHGKRFLELYANFAIPGRGTTDQKLLAFNNDAVKGAYVLNDVNGMSGIKNYTAYQNFMNKYGQYFSTADQKLMVEELGTKLYSMEKGPKPAINFTYPDQNGKVVSLSDFKGKVVIVDVWATWCAPCKQQIPYLKKMEEEFKGKDVAFISVTVDYEKDKQKWLDMIKEMNLGGTQMFAAGWSKITKDYAISSVPRFMMFDKKGNVVSVDAPRPSNPKLKEMLEKELLKGNE